MAPPSSSSLVTSQGIALQSLDEALRDFGLSRKSDGSQIRFVGGIPALSSTKSEKINLSLIGAIPALANAVAATQIYEARGGEKQTIEIDLRRGHNYIDPDIGMTPSINGQEITVDVVVGNPFLRNIFETKDGRHVVLSAVYVDLVYQWSSFLGCSIEEQHVRATIKKWNAADLETAATKAGLPMAVVFSEAEWAASPQGSHLTALPIAPVQHVPFSSAPRYLSLNPQRPLEGIKVLCATHAIAGPCAGRTLAEHGASVLQVIFTHGFEHNFVYTYANLGGASTRLNLHKDSDKKRMWELIKDADVWVDSYREGGLSKFGFDDKGMHAVNEGLIICHVRCYGSSGPWKNKPGFDMQGSSSSGLMAYCGDGIENPQWPPGMVINDYTTGYYGALAVQACILKRIKEGGGFVVAPSLTGTAMSILKYFKSDKYQALKSCDAERLGPEQMEGMTCMGWLKTLRPLPVLSLTPIKYDPIFLVTMGSSVPVFPGYDDGYDVRKLVPREKHDAVADFGIPILERLSRLRKIGSSSGPQSLL